MTAPQQPNDERGRACPSASESQMSLDRPAQFTWLEPDATPEHRLAEMLARFREAGDAYIFADIEISRAHRTKRRALELMTQTRFAMAQLCAEHELQMPATRLAALLDQDDPE